MDLKDAIEHVQETSVYGLDPIVDAGDGSGRKFLFDFNTSEYKPIERFVKHEGAVSTVESLAELVAEYARRFERTTGKNMTVTFTSSGASFSPDDFDRRHVVTYRRVLSQQWEALKSSLGKAMSHKALIRTLQALSPSIENYPLVFAAFQRLAISKDVKLTSEPVLGANGQSDNTYHVSLSIKGAVAGDTTLPSQITLKLQYARGSSATYEIPVEVDLSENDGTPVITLFAPTLDAVADRAVLDEMSYFDTQMEVSGLPDLLCVVNF
jgi:hypothetical protein